MDQKTAERLEQALTAADETIGTFLPVVRGVSRLGILLVDIARASGQNVKTFEEELAAFNAAIDRSEAQNRRYQQLRAARTAEDAIGNADLDDGA